MPHKQLHRAWQLCLPKYVKRIPLQNQPKLGPDAANNSLEAPNHIKASDWILFLFSDNILSVSWLFSSVFFFFKFKKKKTKKEGNVCAVPNSCNCEFNAVASVELIFRVPSTGRRGRWRCQESSWSLGSREFLPGNPKEATFVTVPFLHILRDLTVLYTKTKSMVEMLRFGEFVFALWWFQKF